MARNIARGMALEHTGWEATVRWAWHWSVDIWWMLEDLANWIVGGKPEAADSVALEMLMLNEVAQKFLWLGMYYFR